MRTREANVISAAEAWTGSALPDADAVFKALRTWKDRDYD
jgi:hypothetical protein